jgi:hypothetical protein
MTFSAFRGSLSVGLLVAGTLCAACGSDAGGADDNGSGATNGGSAGMTGLGQSGAAGSSSATGGSSSVAGSSSSAGTSSGGSFAMTGGSGGSAAGSAGLGTGGTTSGGTGGTNGNAGGSSAGAAGTASGTPSGKTEFAPYYEIGSSTGAFKNLVDLKTKSGVSDVTLAFVLAGSGCNTDNTISGDLTDIKNFVAAGGHVKASFGGADGAYVESKCADAASLATAIGNFVDATSITDLDFDVEQAAVETTAMDTMRGQALKMVQDSKHIQVSLTLQPDENGLDKGARGVVSGVAGAGVSIYHVNLMVMDYGNMAAGTPMAPIAIGSLNGANGQLKTLISGLTTEQAWAMLGGCPDIGQNDDNEIFTIQDANDLAAFAQQNKLGLLTFWNIQRDQVCGKGECSEHDAANFDYANIFKAVAQ